MFIPVILCGGAGTRLWPMSRRLLPKQFLPLAGERTMLQDTALRLEGVHGALAPILVSSGEHRFLVAEQFREIGGEGALQILEPVGRNTAPAVAVAALAAREQAPDALLLVLPSDHLIADLPAFHGAVRTALSLASEGSLVTFGITPIEPATGFGYIEQGPPLAGRAGAFRVARFVEKPDPESARAMLAGGGYLWNSGMFVFPAARYLEELGRHRPDVLAAATASWSRGTRDLDFMRLEAEAFGACPSVSVDYAVMERTGNAAVVAADMGWNDVGSWTALWDVSAKDASGNVARGDVHLQDASGCYVRSESRLVSAIGTRNLLVVETDDAVLVADLDRAQEVKEVVAHLDRNNRSEHVSHRRVFRPWGYYDSIDAGERFQVKRIMVKPGETLSLQMHHRRAEHWVVVTGTARVTRGEEIIVLTENESTYIPLGTRHRLENPGSVPLHLIEVQSGDYLGEDDIVRFEDVYRRG